MMLLFISFTSVNRKIKAQSRSHDFQGTEVGLCIQVCDAKVCHVKHMGHFFVVFLVPSMSSFRPCLQDHLLACSILCLTTALCLHCCQQAHAHRLLVHVYSLLFPGSFRGAIYSNLAIPLWRHIIFLCLTDEELGEVKWSLRIALYSF